MELSEGVGNWLTRPMLADIRDKSECSLIRVLDGEDLVRIIGTKKQVRGSFQAPVQTEHTNFEPRSRAVCRSQLDKG